MSGFDREINSKGDTLADLLYERVEGMETELERLNKYLAIIAEIVLVPDAERELRLALLQRLHDLNRRAA